MPLALGEGAGLQFRAPAALEERFRVLGRSWWPGEGVRVKKRDSGEGREKERGAT